MRTGRRRRSAEWAGERWKQHEHEHQREILDDQPAGCDRARHRGEKSAVGERAQHHDRARHRQREPEHQPRADAPSPQTTDAHAQQCREHDAPERSGNRDASNGKQIVEREVEPDAEHQQDHADLGQLLREIHVGDEPGRRGPEQHAGDEIAHERWQLDARRGVAEYER